MAGNTTNSTSDPYLITLVDFIKNFTNSTSFYQGLDQQVGKLSYNQCQYNGSGFLNMTTQTCESCALNCSFCYNQSACVYCETGFLNRDPQNKDRLNCSSCDISNCQQCYPIINNSTQGQTPPPLTFKCKICENGYEPDSSGLCQPSSTSCAPRYFYDTTSALCQSCPSNCLSCENSTYCNTCDIFKGLKAYQGLCLDYKCVININNGSYFDSTTSTCNKCANGCIIICTDTSTCTSCSNGFSLTFNSTINSNQCTKCPSNCDSCSYVGDFLNCTSCSTGYTFNSSTSQCDRTITCDSGYYYDKSFMQCFKCLPQCKECSSYDTCTSCKSLQFILNSSGQCVDQCKDTIYAGKVMYWNNSTLTCQQCPSNCQNCTYNPIYQNATCKQCSIGYSMNNLTKECTQVPCSSNNTFIIPNTTLCDYCSSGCASCLSADSCTTCMPNFKKVTSYIQNNFGQNYSYCQSNCSSGSYIDLNSLNCEKGFFLDVDQNNHDVCLECPVENCAQCERDIFDTSTNASVNCYVCKDGFMIDWSLNKCVEAPTCQPGFYYEQYWSKCLQCQPGCASCNSNGICKSCADGFTLLDDNLGTCQKKCLSPGTFWNNFTQSCQNCTQGCSSCKNNMTCGICQPGFSLLLNKMNNTSSCIRCPKNCTSCISFMDENHQLRQQCTQCSPNFKVSESKRCQPFNCSRPGYFYDSFYDTCLSCGKDCAVCTGIDRCLECNRNDGSMTIYDGSCQNSCQAPQYFWTNYTTGCLSCQDTIANCTQCSYNKTSNLTSCNQCQKGFKRVDGKCQAIDCNQTGVFQNGTVCDYCSYGCSSCTNPFNCTSCVSGMNLTQSLNHYQGYCVANCSMGEFFNITSGFCEPYDFGCRNGTQNGLCMGCGNGTMMITRDVFRNGFGMLYGNGVQQQSRAMNNAGPSSPNQLNRDMQDGQFGQMINFGMNVVNYNSYKMNGEMLPQMNNTNSTSPPQNGSFMLFGPQSQQDQLKQMQNAGRCINCTRDCLRCQFGMSMEIQCLECRKDFKVHQNGTCVPRNFCEDGFYFNRMEQDCKKCANGCSQCAISSRNCTKCFDNFTLSSENQTCSLRCQRGQFWDNTTAQCISCGNGCALCNSESNCGQCQVSFYMTSNTMNLTNPLSLPKQNFISGGQCNSCPANCTQCGFNPVNNTVMCFQCAQGSKLIENQCVFQSCGMNGTFYDTIRDKCIRCPKNCSQCYNESACLSCNEPRFTMVNSKCVDSCNYKTEQTGQLYYFDNTTSTCLLNTVTNCTRANSSSTCMKCQPGFYLDNTTYTNCVACSANCTDCIINGTSTTCRRCLPGFALNFTTESCDLVNCTQNNTYPLNRSDSNSLCNLCPMGCGKCRGPEVCMNCAPGFVLDLKTQQCQPNCSHGQYFDKMAMQCINCSANCKSCKSNDTCSVCQPEYYLNYLNPFEETEHLPVPQTCNQCPENCHFCFVNTTLQQLRRIETSSELNTFLVSQTPLCAKCNEGYEYKLDQCGFNGCKKDNQYFDDDTNKCKFCPPGCSSCYNDQICIDCYPGFIFNSTSTLCDRNLTNFMQQGSQNNYQLPINGSMNGGMNGGMNGTMNGTMNGSQSMNGSMNGGMNGGMNGTMNGTMNGSQSMNGSLPMNGSNQTMMQGQWQQMNMMMPLNCSLNQFKDQMTQECRNCSQGCGLCESKFTCYFCQDGFSLVSYFDLDLMRNVSACRKDPVRCPFPNQYFDLELAQCLPCRDGCDRCESRDLCTSCEEGKFEIEIGRNMKKCIETCPQGYNGIFEEGRMQCQKCDEGCEYCNDKRCVQCSQSMYALRKKWDEVQCVRKCPQGYFANRMNNTCDQCVPGCKQCNGPTPQNCSVCHDFLGMNHTLLLSNPQQPVPTFCTPNCTEPNKFIDLDGTCQNCSQNCTTCSRSATNCTSCDTSQFFFDRLNMTCVPLNMTNNTTPPMCKKGQYFDPENQGCNKCHESCKNCTGPTPNNCTQCTDTLFAFRPMNNMSTNTSMCVKTCPNGTFHNFVNGTCQPCANNCSECGLQLLSSKQQCLSCGPGAFMSNNSCVANCPQGTFTKGNRCLDCSNNCSQCNETACLSCKDGFQQIIQSVNDTVNPKLFFFARNCTQIVTLPDVVGTEGICPPGTYFNTSLLYCDVCPKGCAQCSSYTTCTASCSVTNADDCVGIANNTITCQDSFVLQPKNRTCASECDRGQFVRNSTCQQCHLNCDSCLNPNQCVNCSRGFFKLMDEDTNTTRCVKECSLVKTEDGVALFSDHKTNSCTPCQPGCARCMNNSVCEVCQPFTTFEKGNCSCNFMYEVAPSLQLRQMNIILYGINFFDSIFGLRAVPCSQIFKLFNNNPQTSMFDNTTFFDEQEIIGMSPLDITRCSISRIVHSRFSPKVERMIPIAQTIVTMNNTDPEFIKGLVTERQLLRLNRRRIMPRNCEEPERSDYRIQFLSINEKDDDQMLAHSTNVFEQQQNMQQMLFQINSTNAKYAVDSLMNGQIQISPNKVMGSLNQMSNQKGGQDKIGSNFNQLNNIIGNMMTNTNQNGMDMTGNQGMTMNNMGMIDSMNINIQGRSLQAQNQNQQPMNMIDGEDSYQQMNYQNLGISDNIMSQFVKNVGSMQDMLGYGQNQMRSMDFGSMENLAKMMDKNMTSNISINTQDQKIYSQINQIRPDIKLTRNNLEVYKCQKEDAMIAISGITGFKKGISLIQWKVDIMKKQGGPVNENMFNAQSLRDLQQLPPNGSLPNGTFPNGTLPNGTIQNGTFPNGTFPNGSMPNGSLPNGTFPNGSYPNGTNMNQTMQNMTSNDTDLEDQEDEMNITTIQQFLGELEMNFTDTTFIDFSRIFEILEERTQRLDFNLTIIVYGQDQDEYAIEKAKISVFNFHKQEVDRPEILEILSTRNFTFKPQVKQQQCNHEIMSQKLDAQKLAEKMPNMTMNCILADRQGRFIANLTLCTVPDRLLNPESEYLLIYFYSQNRRDKQQNGAVVLRTETVQPMVKITQGSAILVNPGNITRLDAIVNKQNLTNYFTFWSCQKVDQQAMSKLTMCEFNLINYTHLNLTLPEFTMDFESAYRFTFNIVDKKNLTIRSSEEILVYTAEMNERRRIVNLMMESEVDFFNYMDPIKEKQIISCNQTMMMNNSEQMNNATLNITYNLIQYVDGTKMRKVLNNTQIKSNKLVILKGGLQQGSYYEAQCIVMDNMTIGMVAKRFTTITKNVNGLDFSINTQQGVASKTLFELMLKSNSSSAYQCSFGYVQPTLQTKVVIGTLEDYVQNGNSTINTTLPYLNNGTLEVFAQCTDPASGQPIYMSTTVELTSEPLNSTQISELVSQLQNVSSMSLQEVLTIYYSLSAYKDSLNSSSKATTYMALANSIFNNAANLSTSDKTLLAESLNEISQDLKNDSSLASNSKLINDNIKAVLTLLNVSNTTMKQKGALENSNTAISTYTSIDQATFENIAQASKNILSVIQSNSTFTNQSKALIQGLNEAGKQLSASLLSNESVNVSSSEFAMVITKLQPSSASQVQQISLGANSSLSSVSFSLNISDSTFANVANLILQAMVVNKTLRNDSITPVKQTSYDDGTVSTVQTRLASDIFVINTQKSDTETASDDGTFTLQSVSVSNLETPLYFVIDAESTLTDSSNSSIKGTMNCMYYDSYSSAWKTSECVASQDGISAGQTLCCSYHMTEFAVVETLTVRTQPVIAEDDENGESEEPQSFVVAVVIIFDIYLGLIGLIGFFLDKYRKLVLYNKMDTKPSEPQFQDLRKLQESGINNEVDVSERQPPTTQHNIANNPPSDLIANKKKGKKQMKKDNRNLHNVSPQESEQIDENQARKQQQVQNPNQYYPKFNQQVNQALAGMNERNDSHNSSNHQNKGTIEYKEQRFEGGSEEEQEDNVAHDLSKDTKKKQRPRTGNKKHTKSIDTEKTKKNSNASSKQHLFDDDDNTSQNNKSSKLSDQKKKILAKTNPAKNSQDKMILHQDSDDEEQYGDHDKTHGGLEESNQNINVDDHDDDHIIPHEQQLSRNSLNNSREGLVQTKNGLVNHPVVVRQMSIQKGSPQQEGPFSMPAQKPMNMVVERTYASNPVGSKDKSNLESVKVRQNTCCDVYQASLKVYNRVGGPVFSESPFYPRPLKTLNSVVQFFSVLTLTGAFMTLANMNPGGSIIATLIIMRVIQILLNLMPAKVLQKEQRTVSRNISVCVGYFILLILLHIFSLLMGNSAASDVEDSWKRAFVGAIFIELIILDIILIPLFTTIMAFCCCRTKHFLALTLSMTI